MKLYGYVGSQWDMTGFVAYLRDILSQFVNFEYLFVFAFVSTMLRV